MTPLIIWQHSTWNLWLSFPSPLQRLLAMVSICISQFTTVCIFTLPRWANPLIATIASKRNVISPKCCCYEYWCNCMLFVWGWEPQCRKIRKYWEINQHIVGFLVFAEFVDDKCRMFPALSFNFFSLSCVLYVLSDFAVREKEHRHWYWPSIYKWLCDTAKNTQLLVFNTWQLHWLKWKHNICFVRS